MASSLLLTFTRGTCVVLNLQAITFHLWSLDMWWLYVIWSSFFPEIFLYPQINAISVLFVPIPIQGQHC